MSANGARCLRRKPLNDTSFFVKISWDAKLNDGMSNKGWPFVPLFAQCKHDRQKETAVFRQCDRVLPTLQHVLSALDRLPIQK